jgi:hypothetical protein
VHEPVEEGVELDIKEGFLLHDLLGLKEDIDLLLKGVRF